MWRMCAPSPRQSARRHRGEIELPMTFRINSSARLIAPRQRLFLFFVAVWLVTSVGMAWPGGQSSPSVTTWYKGNTHTHTLNSDGDSTPDEVVRWYRSHGY